MSRLVTETLANQILGKAKKNEASEEGSEEPKGKNKPEKEFRTPQVTVLGQPEIAFVLKEALKLCDLAVSDAGAFKAKIDKKDQAVNALKKYLTKEHKENLKELGLNAGLDAAMFGRMVTGDILARTDAALHVAHAFTVHAEQSESDYFSAVDDLLKDSPDGGLGSGHINSAELTSGLFYGYVVINVPGLCANLGKDQPLAREVTRRMVHLIATVSPGAKLGSTAPHSYASMILVEAANSQPRTLANSFLVPVRTAPDLLANSYDAIATHLGELDRVYGRTTRRAVMLGAGERLASVIETAEIANSLVNLANWTADQVECADA